jgi:rubredoxin
MTSTEQLYQCPTQTCNYIYGTEWGDKRGGIPPGTRFEDVPEDWRCPYCGGGREKFRRLREPRAKEEPVPDAG